MILSLKQLLNSGIILSIAILLISCGSESNTSEASNTSEVSIKGVKGLTTSGYHYVHYIRNEGAKPNIGDEVVYDEVVLKNDSLVSSTILKTEPVRAIMPPKEKVAVPPPPNYEALFKMSVGDSLTVFHFLDTFKNYQLPGWLKQSDTLKYTISLVSMRSKADVDAEMEEIKKQEKQVAEDVNGIILKYKSGKLDSQLKTTESGLKYLVQKEGTGKQATKGKVVEVNYSGFLTDGTNFDNSFKKGVPFKFFVGRGTVIDGWDEGIPLMKEGGKAIFFIPYQLAYGAAGRPPKIPEKAELVFYIDLIRVK